MPNVLFVLDNSANWSASIPAAPCFYKDNGGVATVGPKATSPDKEQGKKMAIEKCALYNLVDALPVRDQRRTRQRRAVQDRHHAAERVAERRALIRARPSPLSPPTTRPRFKTLIKSLGINNDKA